MSDPKRPDGTGAITFLFTDIAGSTRLWEEEPETMQQRLARHDELLHAAVEQHGGFVFKTVGDAFCAVFERSPDAVCAAVAAQRVLRQEVPTLPVRMAIHTGSAEARGGDYFGGSLNRVARLLAAGHGGQVLLSGAASEAVRGTLPDGVQLRYLGKHQLRDLTAWETIFQLQPPGFPARFPPLNTLDVAYRRGLRRAAAASAAVVATVGILALLAYANARRANMERERTRRVAANLRRNLYAADMDLTLQALEEDNLPRAQALLAAYLPAAGEEDLRTFEWRYLSGLCRDQSVWTFRTPGHDLLCASYSPDGRMLAAAGEDLRIHLFDTRTRQELAPLPPLPPYPRRVVFSPDGRTLAAHCWDGSLVVFDLATRRETGRLQVPQNYLAGIVFSRDGRLLATTGVGGPVRLMDAASLREVASVPGGGFVVFSPDGRTLATRGERGGVALWQKSARRARQLPLPPHSEVNTVAFSPDGRKLAAGMDNGGLRVWDLGPHGPPGRSPRSMPPDAPRLLSMPRGHRDWVYSLAFSPDGRRLASSSNDSTIRLWDPHTGRALGVLRGHQGEVVTVAFSPDGDFLASASTDDTVKLWPITGARQEDSFHASGVALSRDGRTLATVSDSSNEVALRDTGTMRISGRLKGPERWIWPLAFSGGDRLYTALGPAQWNSDQIAVWNVATRRETSRIPVRGLPFGTQLSPDGRLLVAWPQYTGGGSLRIIDLAGRRELPTLPGAPGCFSPDGRLLAVAESSGALRAWDTRTWQPVVRVPRSHGTSTLSFSPDGRFLVSGGFDGVQVWDTATWTQRAAFRAFPGMMRALAFSPDGRTLVTTGGLPVVKFWNTATWRMTLALETGRGAVNDALFTADGRALVTRSQDGEVRVWRAPPFSKARLAGTTAGGRQ